MCEKCYSKMKMHEKDKYKSVMYVWQVLHYDEDELKVLY